MTDDRATGKSRSVLNAGAGPRSNSGLPRCFRTPDWTEVRLDLDAGVEPDVVGSVTDLRSHFGDGTFDAIWCSHNLEHLHDHEVSLAIAAFRRVLKPDGFAVVTCPDLEAVAESLLAIGLDGKAYDAPVGPITVHDMIFGHGGSIAGGNGFMAHRTGFTQDRLGAKATEAGFGGVRVGRGGAYDLWAVLPMDGCDAARVAALVRDTPLAFLYEVG